MMIVRLIYIMCFIYTLNIQMFYAATETINQATYIYDNKAFCHLYHVFVTASNF